MKCPKCNESVQEDQKFCAKCGTLLNLGGQSEDIPTKDTTIREYRPIKTVAKISIGLLVVTSILEMLDWLVVDCFYVYVGVVDFTIMSYVSIVNDVSICCQACVFIASSFFIGVWIYRCAWNKYLLSTEQLERTGRTPLCWAWNKYLLSTEQRKLEKNLKTSPFWSVGWFFIPIFNIYRPYLAMKQIWFASNGKPYNDSACSYWFIRFWWASWILSWLLGSLCVNPHGGYEPVAIVSIVWNACTILTIFLISTISRAQTAVLENSSKRYSCGS